MSFSLSEISKRLLHNFVTSGKPVLAEDPARNARTARHEAGHTIVALFNPYVQARVSKVTIDLINDPDFWKTISWRGYMTPIWPAAGDQDREKALYARLLVDCAGAAGEEMGGDEVPAKLSENDSRSAYFLAVSLLCPARPPSTSLIEELKCFTRQAARERAAENNGHVSNLIKQVRNEAKEIIQENEPAFRLLTEKLLQEKTLSEERLIGLLNYDANQVPNRSFAPVPDPQAL